MSNKENELDKQWRKRIEEIGQKAFEFEEMRRLGFLSEEKVACQNCYTMIKSTINCSDTSPCLSFIYNIIMDK